MSKKENNKISFPDLVSFVDLSKAVHVPRRTLLTWHKILSFPAIIPEGKYQKLYSLNDCIVILELFKAEQERGFKRNFAASNVRKSDQYKAIVEKLKSKYPDCEVFLLGA